MSRLIILIVITITGYLAASLFLHEDHELIVLLINTLQKVGLLGDLTLKNTLLLYFFPV